ncbi:uncharacterized protein EDB93DRAFT_1106678 [Suillus bovinus]|uniref:uncharacterized protein n=1 Tax=Suillus bovinus TaxID=48563 RepID=UPI001B85CA49|nr:uncharacterized protein EDB93DRAFT_1106678 [Suillus bovinus]KAG2137129.1 hypothetical protein EDB93DRAFT_1106678 [Suillus bovinus]
MEDPVTKLSKNLSSRVDELLRNSSPFELFSDTKIDDRLLEKAKMRLWNEWQKVQLSSSAVQVKTGEIAKIELSRAAVTIAYAAVNSLRADWDVHLAKYFKTPSFSHILELTMFVDKHRRILTWNRPIARSSRSDLSLAKATEEKNSPWRSQGFVVPPGGGGVWSRAGDFMPWWIHAAPRVSLGQANQVVLDLPDLGAQLGYPPGTMVYIAGKVLEHGVPGWGDGERIVIAHFIKDKVHDKQGIPRPSFPIQHDLLKRVGAGRGLKPVYLDVNYIAYKPTIGRRGKPSWLESRADPLYEILGKHSSSSSPRKRAKEVLMDLPDIETFTDFGLEGEAAQDARKTKTQNNFIAEYLAYRDLYLDIILELEQFTRAGICETCQSAEGIFSCLTCTGDHGWCRPCMVKLHQSLLFHKIRLWTGKCFKDVKLADQGLIWYLGHGGESCPWYEASQLCDSEVEALAHNTTSVTIVHSSGVFMHNVAWCHCPGSNSQHVQLLKVGLFPASFTCPKTAFTFEVLDHFLIDALECKTSARSFYEKLTRLTNNAFQDTVPDRYHELMRVSRLWRDLKNRKWFGFGHDVKPEPGPGDLALFCPSCLQPGINMSLLWEQKYERQVV